MNTSTMIVTQNVNSSDDGVSEDNTEIHVGVVVCLVGLVMNIAACATICRGRQKKKKMRSHTRFLLNIIHSDIWISVSGAVYFTLCLYKSSLFTNSDTGDEKIRIVQRMDCAHTIIGIFWMIGPIANLLGLALMSLDHFIAIGWPLKHHKLQRRSTIEILIASAWIVALIRGITYYFNTYESLMLAVTNFRSADFDSFCENWEEQKKPRPSITGLNFTVILLTTIGLVFLAIFGMYCYIAWIAFKAIKTKWYFQRYSKTAPTKSRSAQKRMRQFKGIGTTILLLSSFMLLWTPISVYYLLSITKSLVINPNLKCEIILIDVVCCTSLVDVVIYFMRSKEGAAVLRRYRLKLYKASIPNFITNVRH